MPKQRVNNKPHQQINREPNQRVNQESSQVERRGRKPMTRDANGKIIREKTQAK